MTMTVMPVAAVPGSIAVVHAFGLREEQLGIPHDAQSRCRSHAVRPVRRNQGQRKVLQRGKQVCPNCGLHKGSVLCCSTAINGRRDIVLCRKCGEVAFGKKCCQPGPVLCTKCGLHKGSPGCCKIEKVAAEAGDDAHEGGHS